MRFLAILPLVTLAHLASAAPTLSFAIETPTPTPAAPGGRPTPTSTPTAIQSSAIVPATGRRPPFVTPIATTGFELPPGRGSSPTPTAIQSSAIVPATGRRPPFVTPIATTGFERTTEPSTTFSNVRSAASDSDAFGGPTSTETGRFEPSLTEQFEPRPSGVFGRTTATADVNNL
ncbi:hypothetical protein HDU87_008632 [Geranomyces variabilis]|uniref:Uncharacterized protein n=1 Tax=Geranomyces variabilis TaxID=109894 RepID=A0AAD5TED6_9FUNG|nr:hypothetical protein HDU87_008632 [Geranomyces variabilis]